MKEQLTKLLRATPFSPFIIKMSDGQAYEIRQPENLVVGTHFMVLIEPETDRTHDLYLLHVTSIEQDPAVPSTWPKIWGLGTRGVAKRGRFEHCCVPFD